MNVGSKKEENIHLQCRGGRHLRRVGGGGDHAEVVHVHELPVQLGRGGDRARARVHREHLLAPAVHQRHHAVGEGAPLRVRGGQGGHGVPLAALLPHRHAVVRPLEERRVGGQRAPHPGLRTARRGPVILQQVVGHLGLGHAPGPAPQPARDGEGDLQLARQVAAGLVHPGPGDAAGAGHGARPHHVLLVAALAPRRAVVRAARQPVVVSAARRGRRALSAARVREGDGMEQEGEAAAPRPRLRPAPAGHVGAGGQLRALGVGGDKAAVGVEAEARGGRGLVRQPRVELVQPRLLRVQRHVQPHLAARPAAAAAAGIRNILSVLLFDQFLRGCVTTN